MDRAGPSPKSSLAPLENLAKKNAWNALHSNSGSVLSRALAAARATDNTQSTYRARTLTKRARRAGDARKSIRALARSRLFFETAADDEFGGRGAKARCLGNRSPGARRREDAKAQLGFRHCSSLERVAFLTTRTEVAATGELLSLRIGRDPDPRRALGRPERFNQLKSWRRTGRTPIRDGAGLSWGVSPRFRTHKMVGVSAASRFTASEAKRRMNQDQFGPTEAQFSKIAPQLPADARGKPETDDPRVISGIVHLLRSGGRRVDAARENGPRKTPYDRCVRRWAACSRRSLRLESRPPRSPSIAPP